MASIHHFLALSSRECEPALSYTIRGKAARGILEENVLGFVLVLLLAEVDHMLINR